MNLPSRLWLVHIRPSLCFGSEFCSVIGALGPEKRRSSHILNRTPTVVRAWVKPLKWKKYKRKWIAEESGTDEIIDQPDHDGL
jgi:hypothetical protein